MANKALSTRQKMTIRVEPSQKPPRNPVALAAKARSGGAGPHAKPAAAERQAAKRLLAKAKLKPDPDEQ
ncbi:hypothetical protein JOD97_003542 [Duganella sp. 1411]|uniref:hypothetical protein n=1 Tax=Duganella sp. 1411 TaxID=2806572 RepID=UPI001AE2DD3F|nr:hypothetical protein [Duganella sp. 1411]MBP1205480.1 hypothetical protein [Duganella sp. 1411]